MNKSIAVAVVLAGLTVPATASASEHVSKPYASRSVAMFATPGVAAVILGEGTATVAMPHAQRLPARFCARVNRRTVDCPVLYSGVVGERSVTSVIVFRVQQRGYQLNVGRRDAF